MKDHHVFKSESRPGNTLLVLENQVTLTDAIIVKLYNGSNVGHFPDLLAHVLAPMLRDKMHGVNSLLRTILPALYYPINT